MMKTTAFLLFVSFALTGQPKDGLVVPQVDVRVELLSIMQRLAMGPAYTSINPYYDKVVQAHFAPYASHPAIHYLRKMVDSLQLAGRDPWFREWPALAVHLSPPPALKPLVRFRADAAERWDDRTLLLPEVISRIQTFYRDSHAAAFFDSQQRYYQAVSDRFRASGVHVDDHWLQSFFSLPKTETYYPIIMLGTSAGGYLRVNLGGTTRHTATLFTVSSFDSQGMPENLEDPGYRELLLHEQVHAYANQLVDGRFQALEPAAQRLLHRAEVWDKFKATFYNNGPFLLYETLVRAGSLRYAVSHPHFTEDVETLIKAEEAAGFFWLRGLVDVLGTYEANRTSYPTLQTFMPEVIRYLEKVSTR
jgi:hypothetical protein